MALLKVIELMASSKKSWEDAAGVAVSEATKTVKGISSVYVKDQSCTVKNGQVDEYRVTVKVSFTIEH